MPIEEMKARKRELGYSNKKLSELSGVPLGTINKLFSGATRAPRSATIVALTNVLQPEGPADDQATGKGLYVLREPGSGYGTGQVQRRNTVEDYYALPADARMELIDGVFYDMAAPDLNHQQIVLSIASQFLECEKKRRGKCRVIIAPCDVQLDQDDFTMVQPDILIVCDPEKLRPALCYGAPDLTVEVMSPSSRSHDAIRKLNKYRKAGVKEYWLVDPENREVLVYRFESHNSFMAYSFDDKVPVGISDGKCLIDLREIQAMLLTQP